MVLCLLFALILTVQAQEKTLGPQDFQSYRDRLETLISDGVAILEGRGIRLAYRRFRYGRQVDPHPFGHRR